MRSSISLSLAAVLTGLAAPKIDEAATGAPTSATGSVRGFNCSFGRSVTAGAAGSGSRTGAGSAATGSDDLVQAFSLWLLSLFRDKHLLVSGNNLIISWFSFEVFL